MSEAPVLKRCGGADAMPQLASAAPEQIEQIASESFAQWGVGLTLADYQEVWRDLARTDWGRKWLRHVVWLGDDGSVLSSAKVYRPLLRCHDRIERCTVLAAVYTPRRLRRRGFAGAMLRSLVAECDHRRDLAALLFSDIGIRWYERLGFRALPALQYEGEAPRGLHGEAQALELRPARREDLAALAAAHAATSARRELAIVRDSEHWEFLWLRSAEYFARLRDREISQSWSFAVRDAGFCGYAVSVEGHGEWDLREAGSIDGDPRATAAIVARAAWEARLRGCTRFRAWLPPETERSLGPFWRLIRRRRATAVPMVRLGDEASGRLRLDDVFVPYLDQF